jgi:hypothetical protein
MERAEYLCEENWWGSYYELALELGPSGDDAMATRAQEALWRLPELRGPWRELADFSSVPDTTLLAPEEVRSYGVLAFDRNTELGLMSHFVRIEGQSDWLELSIPTGMLELRFPVRYPIDLATNTWLCELDRLLVRIAARIYKVAPFRLGLLGEEASGSGSASKLTATDCEHGGFVVPEALWHKLAPKRVPDLIDGGMVYAPLTGPHITYGGGIG